MSDSYSALAYIYNKIKKKRLLWKEKMLTPFHGQIIFLLCYVNIPPFIFPFVGSQTFGICILFGHCQYCCREHSWVNCWVDSSHFPLTCVWENCRIIQELGVNCLWLTSVNCFPVQPEHVPFLQLGRRILISPPPCQRLLLSVRLSVAPS